MPLRHARRSPSAPSKSTALSSEPRPDIGEAVELGADNRIWRNDEDGRAILLHITNAGLAAIGVEPDGGDNAPTGADAASSAEASQDAPAETDPAPKARTPRTGTKQAKLIEMLRTEGGATIDEMVAALDWRPHTVRGALAGALKKKLGLTVTSEKVEGRGRCYRIEDAV